MFNPNGSSSFANAGSCGMGDPIGSTAEIPLMVGRAMILPHNLRPV